MQRNAIHSELTGLAFEFFYWFSRFESALKENEYLKSKEPGANAEPGWNSFVKKWEKAYEVSPSARALVGLAPKKQIVGDGRTLTWVHLEIAPDASDLNRIALMLRTVRNNLFHGGKHGEASWDDPERVRQLLAHGIVILHELAAQSGLSADFDRVY